MTLNPSSLGTDLPSYPQLSLNPIGETANLEQALLRRILTAPGALWYDRAYGLGIRQYLNSRIFDGGYEIATRMETQLLRDERVLECAVTAEQLSLREWRFVADILTRAGPHRMVFAADGPENIFLGGEGGNTR